LQEIIVSINSDENNTRIASNLDLNKEILVLLHDAINPFTLSILDYKIQNINSLANDCSLQPISRASNAMKKFSRLSESEIVTPEKITDEMISILPDGAVTNSTILLDIAAKQGEFVYAAYKKHGKAVADNFYSIPTSKIAYEFTRKVYTLLELDVSHIMVDYTSYDLLEENNIIENDKIKIGDKYMKFDVIVGNPPYQVSDGGAQVSAKPIYHKFTQFSKGLNPQFISMIMPTRWYAGGKGLDEFRDEMLNDNKISVLHDFLNPEQVFPNTNIRGGICNFLWEKNYNNEKSLIKVVTHQLNTVPVTVYRSLKTEHSDTFIRHGIAISIVKKIRNVSKIESLAKYVSSAKAFGFRTYFINDERFKGATEGLINPIICYGRGGSIGFVENTEVISHRDWIDVWKVYVTESNNIGTELNDDNQNSFVGKPGTICTETFLVVGADLSLNEVSSNNLSIYLRTKFARFLHSLAKISQHGTSKTYQFVPLQNFTATSDIDWSQSIADIDHQLYAKYELSEEEVAFIEGMIKVMG
jgi:Eco57I restriction-modification methylase